MKKIKAIFFDIDGTLRDFEKSRIPESAKEALRRAREEGIFLCIATGRHKLEIEEEDLLEGIEFDGYVTLNGQFCYCGRKVVHERPIPQENVAALLEFLRYEPFPCLFMEADRMYINMVNDQVRNVQAGIGTRIPPVCDAERAGRHKIYQIVPYIGEELAERIKPLMPGCEFIRWHDAGAFDIVTAGAGKALGVGEMIRHLGVSREQTAAIGDGRNDVTMIEYAGIGIAMGNGKEEAKNAASYVTDAIENDGLSKAVFYILEKNHQEE